MSHDDRIKKMNDREYLRGIGPMARDELQSQIPGSDKDGYYVPLDMTVSEVKKILGPDPVLELWYSTGRI